MDLPEFLCNDSDSEIRIAGHRIRLIDVAARYAEGHSPETILLDYYPTLDLPLIHKTIAFYLEHQPEVDALIDQNMAEMDRLAMQHTSNSPTWTELRRRMTNSPASKAI